MSNEIPPRDSTGAMSSHPRILVVLESLRENGAVRMMLTLLKEWNAAGLAASLFVVQQAPDGDLAVVPEPVAVTTGTRRPARVRATILPGMWRLLREVRQYDVVVSGSEIGLGLLLGYLTARITRRTFVVAVHAHIEATVQQWVPRPLRGLTRAAIAHCDAAVCASADLVPDVLQLGVRPGAVTVVRNGISVPEVLARAQVGQSPTNADSPIVIATGRLSREKGFDHLIAAHSEVLRDGIRHQLLILGEGPERPRLEGLIRDLNLTQTVGLPGFLANPLPIMSAGALYCLSSIREGLPIALLEAAALGVPILATRASDAVIELLGDGLYGDLVEAGSAHALAAGLRRLLKQPEGRRDRSAQLLGQLRSYDMEAMCWTYLDAISAAVERSSLRTSTTTARP